MLEKLSSKEMFNNTNLGLQRVYQLLYAQNGTGITKEDLLNTDQLTMSDMSFVQLLNQDFAKIDKDKDGTISASELDKLTQDIKNKGISQDQLYSLYTQTGAFSIGMDKSLLETVLMNFTHVDKNNDGKISEAEISLYQIEKSIAKQEQDFGFKSSDISIYYADDTTSSDSDESLLNYKYQDS